jgi:hypothetical protein
MEKGRMEGIGTSPRDNFVLDGQTEKEGQMKVASSCRSRGKQRPMNYYHGVSRDKIRSAGKT